MVALALLLLTACGGTFAGAEEARVDLNAASTAELEALPGVGPSKAQAIIAHRDVAPFKSTEELIEVKGIGEKLYAQLKDRVTVSAAGAARKAPGEASAGSGAQGKAGRTASAASAR